MSEPDWIGPASDCLKANFSEEAGEYLLAVVEKLESAVVALEALVRPSLRGRAEPDANLRAIGMIAQHRGETPEATLARLSPRPGGLHADLVVMDEVASAHGHRGGKSVVAETMARAAERAGRRVIRVGRGDTRVTLKTGEELDLSVEGDRERFDRLAFRRGIPPTP